MQNLARFYSKKCDWFVFGWNCLLDLIANLCLCCLKIQNCMKNRFEIQSFIKILISCPIQIQSVCLKFVWKKKSKKLSHLHLPIQEIQLPIWILWFYWKKKKKSNKNFSISIDSITEIWILVLSWRFSSYASRGTLVSVMKMQQRQKCMYRRKNIVYHVASTPNCTNWIYLRTSMMMRASNFMVMFESR